MSEQCLELKNVCKSFRDFTLNNISFTLPQGYIMGLVGPNGAGKTTTIQLILNMLEKDAGKILAFGKDNVVSEKEIKQDIGIVFDSIFYVDSWTVKDTEKAVSIFYDNWRHDIFNDMVKRFDLPLNKKVGELSRGMQMKLMLACAFSHDAKLLILDEPTSGLDPLTRDEFLEILQDYIRDGQRSVLFSTHITTDLERVADYITLINRGNMIFTGTNIFAIQEKNHLDRLYGSVCVSLNEVVLGRYTFVFLNYFTSMVVIIILYLGFVLCRKATFDVPDIMLGLGLSFLVFSTITGIQMPLFFKMGYTKAKLWSVIPFAVVMLLVVLPSFVSALSGILDFAQSHKELFAFACILTSCIIQFVSYHIAVIFYRKQR